MRSPVAVKNLDPVWINPSCHSVQENWFWKYFLSNEPLHKILLSAKVSLNLILELPCALYSVYSPSVGVIGLVSTFVLTQFLIFTEEDPDFVPDDVE